MDSHKLYVPIELQAMVVNDQVRKGENFQRWEMKYNNLSQYTSPEPQAFSENTAVSWNNMPQANGVYLHWTLPQAVRAGTQSDSKNQVEFPLVPNRWLVIRYAGPLTNRTATGWIVESDFLDPNEGTTAFIDPNSKKQFETTLIGRKIDISSWQETALGPMFLNAIGAGDITFAAYQPYNENVFSIHDPLTDVTDPVLTYAVVGWYSDPTKDILATASDQAEFNTLMNQLNWELDAGNAELCNRSVFHGICYGIEWDQHGAPPASDKPERASLAVGNTSIDALTTLIHKQAMHQDGIHPKLLEAFQYGLLPVLDQPNGPELLDQAIHKAWFTDAPGGYEWVIVKSDKTDANAGSEDWSDPNLSPEWLATLNQNQVAYDEAWRDLQEMQWNLYRLWWTSGKFQNIGTPNRNALKGMSSKFQSETFNHQLDENHQGSLAQKVKLKVDEVTTKQKAIPFGQTKKELEASIRDYIHHAPNGYELKRFSKKNFSKANDPVVLISGAHQSARLTENRPLQCRVESELISGIKFQSHTIDAGSMGDTIPRVETSKLTSFSLALLTEFFFLDPNNATHIASTALHSSNTSTIEALTAQMATHGAQTIIGTLPGIALQSWRQPWSPMFLLWTVMYYPIPYETDHSGNWTFNGEQYNWTGPSTPESKPIMLSGTTLITPQCSHNFKTRLEEYRAKHPDLDSAKLSSLDSFIESTDNWDFLSQTLDGFMQQLIGRDSRPNRTPASEDSITHLMGFNKQAVPFLGKYPVRFSRQWPKSDFQPIRAGQFCFEKLAIVDRFGQSLELCNSTTYLQFKPVRAQSMLPLKTVLSQEPYRFVELKPRIPQPARLCFDFVSALDDSKLIGQHHGANPICGWVIPNHIDHSLLCYDPQGDWLGELMLITDTSNKKVVYWKKAPNSPYSSLAQIRRAFHHLGQMIDALSKQGPSAFSDFYLTIDETLWEIDPSEKQSDANLSVLIGRPLALVRSRLKYELDGPPATDHSWEYTFDLTTSVLPNYTFPVRLGARNIRNDGLIGYFFGTDYNRFNCVQKPEGTSSSSYTSLIKEGNFIDLGFNRDEAFITMLVDPRANVHATTAILPTQLLHIQSKFVEPALKAMQICFRVGPVLTATQATDSGQSDGVSKLEMPLPAAQTHIWRWMSLVESVWKIQEVEAASEEAVFPDNPPILQSGIIVNSGLLKKKNSSV